MDRSAEALAMTAIEQGLVLCGLGWCLFGWLADRSPPDD